MLIVRTPLCEGQMNERRVEREKRDKGKRVQESCKSGMLYRSSFRKFVAAAQEASRRKEREGNDGYIDTRYGE